MSHYTEVMTVFQDRDCLIEALKEMGYEVEVHEGDGEHLFGYKGDKRPQKANVIVRRKFINRMSNDYGWKWNSEGGFFTEVISEYDTKRKHLDESKLKQLYVEKKVCKRAKSLGYRIKRQSEKGEVRLTLVKY